MDLRESVQHRNLPQHDGIILDGYIHDRAAESVYNKIRLIYFCAITSLSLFIVAACVYYKMAIPDEFRSIALMAILLITGLLYFCYFKFPPSAFCSNCKGRMNIQNINPPKKEIGHRINGRIYEGKKGRWHTYSGGRNIHYMRTSVYRITDVYYVCKNCMRLFLVKANDFESIGIGSTPEDISEYD